MPTYARTHRFVKDHAVLSREEKARFRTAVDKFVEDLRSDRSFRKGLRVKGIKGAEGIYEMTWADDGRATFQYGEEQVEGELHIVWRRVGTRDILDKP